MLCECIPIVSNVNFLPEIIGNSGFVLNKRNKKYCSLIRRKNSSDTEKLSKLSRDRIKKEFHVSKRKEMLISTLKELK